MSLSLSWYESCSELHNGDTDLVMQCISNMFEERGKKHQANMTSWLLVISGALVFFMQAGFAMLCAGCVRKKNIQNTMMKNLLDACGAGLAFYLFGYALAFGDDGGTDKTFVGSKHFFLQGDVDGAFWFFQYAFAASSVTIVAGTLAERCRMIAYLFYSLFLTGFVYPVVVHAIWSNNGYLSAFATDPFRDMGVIDFAGSGVVHLTGGMTALIAAYRLGPRRGRFDSTESEEPIKGHSHALQCLGTMILWFGWYGFNAGSALLLSPENNGEIAGSVAANTSLAAGVGAMSALLTKMFWTQYLTGEVNFDLVSALNGALAGLVAVTAPCGTIERFAACLIGLIAGWIYLCTSGLLVKLQIDDVVDGIPIHLFNGIWGLLAVGLFSSPDATEKVMGNDDHVGLFYSLGQDSFDTTLLVNQIIGILAIVAWVCITMFPFFLFLDHFGWLRSAILEEVLGLDASYHNGQPNELSEGVSGADVRRAVKEQGKDASRGRKGIKGTASVAPTKP